jgi:hypothetical protein
MSLTSWSYPFYDEQRPLVKKATSRKKITKLDDDDSSLADYKPESVQPDPPVQMHESPMHEPEPQINREGDLLEKLNYMIYLLEEKRDEKTEHVTEEIILYLFLGIFVIFMVDSFVKTGKYSR